MKNLILFLVFFGYIFCGYSQSTKTLVRSFRTETNNIELLFECEKEFRYWDNEHIKVIIDININKNENILETLIKIGRYSLKEETYSDMLFLTLPKLRNDVIVRGGVIKEDIKVILYLPKHMSYNSEQISL
jgi:hypothetical protein